LSPRPLHVLLPTLFLLCAAPALAQTEPPPAPAVVETPNWVMTLQFENDVFVSDNDGHFTHGTLVSLLSEADKVPWWVRRGAQMLPFFDDSGSLRAGFSLGQNIYTPDDISRLEPDPKDQPYAGWLYLSAGLASDTGHRLDRVDLSLGIVGPQSYAEDTQTLWHELIGAPRPQGWDRQLKNEPAVLLTYERQYRLPVLRGGSLLGLEFDTTPGFGAAVGNVFDYVAAGATVRIGQGLASDYGPPMIQPSLPGSGFFETEGGFGWYLFAGFQSRLVAHNVFLDGNTFADSPSVDRRPLVADAQFGLVLTFPRYRVHFTQVFRTKEFHGQDEPTTYGAVGLSFRF